MEVDERVVARGVLVADLRLLGVVLLVERGVAAGRGHAGAAVLHVLHVAAPAQAALRELVRDRQRRARVDAALPDRLAVRVGPERHEVREDLAVGLRHRVGRLSADHRDVVAQALVRDRVVLRQELALGDERAREVLRVGVGAEGLDVVLVLEHDHEDVPDRRRSRGRRGMRGRRWSPARATGPPRARRG